MKKFILFLLSALVAAGGFAQAPGAINYQAVTRDAAGNLIANQAVAFQLTILHNGASGTPVFQERQVATTNPFGLATLSIGKGIPVFGNLLTIDWGDGTYWLKTEMDPAGGFSFQPMGTTELLSVPYSLFSKKSGDAPPVAQKCFEFPQNPPPATQLIIPL